MKKEKKRTGAVWYVAGGIVLSALLIFGIPLAVNWLFAQSTPHELLVARWDEADALSYGGAILSFIGTVVLGVVAVLQTKKAHEQTEQANQLAKDALAQTERANKLTAQMQKLEQAKFVSMVSMGKLWLNKRSSETPKYVNLEARNLEYVNLTAQGFECTDCYHIDALIKNGSDYPIVQIIAHAGARKSIAGTFYGMEDKESAIYIPARGEQAIRFIVPSTVFELQNRYGFTLSLGFVNVFDYVTPATVHIEDLENSNRQQNYKFRLSKFTDIRPDAESAEE